MAAKFILLCALFLFGGSPVILAQEIPLENLDSFPGQDFENEDLDEDQSENSQDLTALKKRKRPAITKYQVINHVKDTSYADTTLTIDRAYRFNYLRRDDFGLLPLNNVGQTYTSLEKISPKSTTFPLFGARARHFNFIEIEDVSYYQVATPFTELYFKTTFEQGQQLDAFITVNTSPRINLSIAYKGVRSLGKYQNSLTSSGHFRVTATYNALNRRYALRTHLVNQDLFNQENGGLSFFPSGDDATTAGIDEYLGVGNLSDDQDRFAERSTISVKFRNAESILKGKRFYLDHELQLLQSPDSSKTKLAIGHELNFTDTFFQYKESGTPNTVFFGESFSDSEIQDKVAIEDFSNSMYISFWSKNIGNIQIKGQNKDYNYGYNSISILGDQSNNIIRIPNRLQGKLNSVSASYRNAVGGFQIQGRAQTNLSKELKGNFITASMQYAYKGYGLSLSALANTVPPNFNFLLHQSSYKTYNWNNDFKNTNSKIIRARIKAKRLLAVEASYTAIDGYTYFTKTETDSITIPVQANLPLRLLKAKLTNRFHFKFLGIDNTFLYQKATEGEAFYKVPQLTTRNSLYFQGYLFRKALYLQLGTTFKYFTAFDADGYDAVLSEFYVQSQTEKNFFKSRNIQFGGFPQFDVFLNAKVQQTRIYFMVENFGEAFQQNKEFSAPGYAPRDAVIRFGLVWNFFL